jgi:hypothetical protein
MQYLLLTGFLYLGLTAWDREEPFVTLRTALLMLGSAILALGALGLRLSLRGLHYSLHAPHPQAGPHPLGCRWRPCSIWRRKYLE